VKSLNVKVITQWSCVGLNRLITMLNAHITAVIVDYDQILCCVFFL